MPLVQYFHTLLAQWTTARLIPFPNVTLPQHLGKAVIQWSFVTRALPLFTALHGMWYQWDAAKNKWAPTVRTSPYLGSLNQGFPWLVRIIPANIGDLLTGRAFAHWIMGDGSANRSGLVLCTDNFTLAEVTLLRDLLMSKWGIQSTVLMHGKTPIKP
jgi:hypothetical protein